MKITKLGHCCLLIETGGVVVLTDPGKYTTQQVTALEIQIDIILVTHEHSDHYHVPSIQSILEKNPDARVVTNTSVQELLHEQGVDTIVLEDGDAQDVAGVHLSGHGDTHAALHASIPGVQNTGFVIDNTLYHPGDAFAVPSVPVDIVALPIAGPWMKIEEAIDFAIAVKPKVAFPVHDDGLAEKSGGAYIAPEKVLPMHNIEFQNINNGAQVDFSHV